jgi:ABC-type nitrate/sulfonate/bicarbonate transport system substrate-binding protein
MMKSRYLLTLPAVAFGLSLTATNPAAAMDKATIAVPGVPPVFSTVFVYVAKEAGFYKKHGVDVRIKPFNSGVAAAKAVATGKVDASLSPTAPVSKIVSNAGIKMVGLMGMEKPDWFIGSMDPSKNKCEDLKGQAVGVDSPRGARWIQLANMARKCKLRPDKHIPTVNLSSNVGSAMVAGRLTFGVLHRDDITVIERESGKKLTIVSEIEKAAPGTHYLLFMTIKKNLAAKRDMYVRMLAANIEAIRYMNDPANLDKVAKIAKVTKRKLGDARNAVKDFVAYKYWPLDFDGLNAKRLAKTIKIQAIVGKKTKGKAGIKPGKKPVAVNDLVDGSLYKEAMKLVK